MCIFSILLEFSCALLYDYKCMVHDTWYCAVEACWNTENGLFGDVQFSPTSNLWAHLYKHACVCTRVRACVYYPSTVCGYCVYWKCLHDFQTTVAVAVGTVKLSVSPDEHENEQVWWILLITWLAFLLFEDSRFLLEY
jgi:hypothetical protein